MEKYEIWRKNECFISGCPSDESESRRYKSTIYIVSEAESEAFSEMMADDSGNQDYSYQVDYKLVCTMSKDDLMQLDESMPKELRCKR